MNNQQHLVYQGNQAEQELMRNLSMQHKTHFRIVCTDMGETVLEAINLTSDLQVL